MTIHKATPVHRIRRVSSGALDVVQREALPESEQPSGWRERPAGGQRIVSEPQPQRHALGPTLGEYLELPFLRWKLLLACCFVSGLAGLLALIVWPRAYESEAKLVITVGRESVGLDPTATTSPTLMLQKTQEEEVNSALEIMSSRQVAELVVEQVGVEAVLSGVLPTTGDGAPAEGGLTAGLKAVAGMAQDAVDHSLLWLGVKDPVGDQELAVRKVMQSIYIFAPKRSTAITIHAEAKTPQVAQALAHAMTQAFLDRHQSVNFNQGSREFFLEQSQLVEAELTQALAERSQFMQSSKVVSTEDQRRMLTDQMGFAQRDVLVARGELQQALAEIEDLTNKAGTTIAEIVATKEEKSDETWSGMRQRVYELEIQEQSFASMYSDDNPKLVNARQQLEGARQILKAMEQERTNRLLTPNPAKLRIEEDLQRLQTKAVGLRSMLTEKEAQQEELKKQIDELLTFELKLNQMDRKIALLDSSLGSLKTKLEEARVIDELQEERISNVNIYQPATLVERPVSPKKSVVLLGALLLGSMVGIGLTLLLEFGSQTMRTPRQVEASLHRPVLASFPLRSRASATAHDALQPVEDCFPARQVQAILAEMLLVNQHPADGRCRTIGVLGIDSQAGASTLAKALALVSSRELGLRTLLVSGDQANSDQSRLPTHAGLDEADEQGWVDETLQIVRVSSLQQRQWLRLDAAGHSPVLDEYRADHDLAFIDLPPADRPDWLSLVVQHVDYMLIVVEANKSDRETAGQLVARLERSGIPVGLVLNKTQLVVPRFLAGLFR